MLELNIDTRTENEIDKIGRYYDKQVPGLSFRFYNNLEFSLIKISKYPTAFSFYNKHLGIRKCELSNFPYKIYFFVDKKQ
jgi:hypothetical protein